MANVALIVHEMRDEAAQHARQLSDWLAAQGHRLIMLDSNVEGLEVPALGSGDGLDAQVRSAESFATDAALVVSLGGDGSMLRAVDLAAPHGVAVLGVNFGQLGYLTEVEPAAMMAAVESALLGNATIEERMRVHVTVSRSGVSAVAGDRQELDAGHALNEALVERGESGRTVRLGLSIDDAFFLSYNADGIIVASPTGSTAYSMSARGPIVAPGHQALVVTAVSPHQLFDRSLVLKPDSEVAIEVLADRPASLSLDGRSAVELEPGDRVVCRRSPIPGRIVTMRGADFLTVLKAKFGLEPA